MSIQSRIASDVYKLADRAVTPEQIKSVQAHLVNSVKDGSVPSYIGVPLIQDLNQKMTSIQNVGAQAQQMVNQPPIAQQVMSEAEQPGLATLPSNLPAQQMAGGGIVAFAGGDLVNDIDPDQEDYFDDNQQQTVEDEEDDALQGMLANMQLHQGALSPSEAGGINALQGSSESFSYKEPGQGEHGIRHEKVTESHGRGLDDLLALIKHKESRGRDYDKEGNPLTSKAGAMFGMQVMPETARNPGYGIAPARSETPEEYNRVGEQLYSHLLNKYQDPKLAAAAYNWGSGNVDRWLTSGADMSKMPGETRNYIQGFKEGGIAHFANQGLVANTSEEIVDPYQGIITIPTQSMASRRAIGRGFPENVANAASADPAVNNLISSQGYQLLNNQEFLADPSGYAKRSLSTLNQTPSQKMPVTQSNLSGQSYVRKSGPGYNEHVMSGTTLDSGNPLVYMPDSQSYMGASDYFNTSAPSGKVPTQTNETEKPAGIEDLYGKYQKDIDKQHDVNAYLGLLSAGLGMMGGTSPYAFANIGQGAQKGIGTYAELEKATGEDQKTLLSARVAAENAKARNDYYKAMLDERRRAALSGEEIKKDAADQRAFNQSSQILRKADEDATNGAQREFNTRLAALSKSGIPPTDEQQAELQNKITARWQALKNSNPSYIKHSKIVFGKDYSPEQLSLDPTMDALVSRNLKPKQ